MKLKKPINETNLAFVGTRYLPIVECMAPTIESAFGAVNENETNPDKFVPLVEFRFSGFLLVEPDPNILEVFETQGKGRFALTGSGYLILNKCLLDEVEKEEMGIADHTDLGHFLGHVFAKIYNYTSAIIFFWPPDAHLDVKSGEDCVAIYVGVSTPCSEEVWRQYQEIHTRELQAMQMNAVKSGMSFESSEGKTLQ